MADEYIFTVSMFYRSDCWMAYSAADRSFSDKLDDKLDMLRFGGKMPV